ncbi:MAG TPA: Gfo/Idh/MocA family oxidoreductase, partial [Candidatus Glassbacteria bacterium]|nr:Gfo/Idh/MocA family oxidoreductase [Candidatus Glassbacteria bacterium]
MKKQSHSSKISRRGLFASGAAMAFAAAAPAIGRVAEANDTINVGVIGTGQMGRSNMNAFAEEERVRIAAVCDCYRPNLDKALKALEKSGKPKPAEYADFRKLLDDKEIDVVIAASPDHWHPLHTVMACRAGKDVYVEKPVSVTVSEGRVMTDVARQTGRIVGVGTQQRSGEHFQRAVEIVRDGTLGRITKVSTWNYENEYPVGIGNPPDCDPPEGLDWNMWLGPAPLRPFNWNRFGVVDDGRWSSFRWFWDYAGGMMTDWGTHLLDIVLWATNQKGPRTVTASGGKLALLDNRDTP